MDATTKNRRLGRGLSSLVSGTPAAQSIRIAPVHVEPKPETLGQAGTSGEVADPSEVESESLAHDTAPRVGEFSHIAVPLIDPNPHQPRRSFDEAGIESLAASIRSAGVVQPVVVRPTGAGRYMLIAGERRLRAARRAGLEVIPAILRHVSDQAAAEWALIENLQREDLNPIDRCDAFSELIQSFGLTHQAIADRVGLDRSSVTNTLRLAELDPFSRDAVRNNALTMGHAKVLLGVSQPEVRSALARSTIRDGWSVRELERRAAAAAAGLGDNQTTPVSATTTPNRHVADLEARLGRHLGTRVRIQTGRRKGAGKLVINFYTLDEFDGLMRRFGFSDVE